MSQHEARARVVVATAAFTGSRRSELQWLKWSDFDEKSGVLDIHRQVILGKELPPKSDSSEAPVPVVLSLAMLLNEYRQRCGNPTDGYIFRTANNDASAG